MDPLSLVANIAAVMGAAKAATQSIKRICALRYAPKQLSELSSEAGDLQTILVCLNEILSSGHSQPHDPVFEHHLRGLLDTASKHIQEMKQMAESFPVRSTTMDLESLKISWKLWLKQKNVGNMSIRLQKIRQEISTALTVLNASEVPHIRTTLRDMILSHENMNRGMRSLEDSANISLRQLAAEIAATRPNIEQLQSSIQQLAINTRETSLSTPAKPNNRFSGPGLLKISRRTTVNDFCDILCACCCHKPVILKSPLWMQNLIGVIFISYFSIFKKYPCTEKTCRRQEKSWVEISICFPSWFLWRILKLRDQWTLNGHDITIRTPRTVDLNSYVLASSSNGNIGSLQTLFSQGLASPFDIDLNGTSSLMVGVLHKQVDTCRFLLQQSADPQQMDIKCRYSAAGYVLDMVLADPFDSTHQALHSLFSSYIDMEEELGVKNFTILHQIVLSLTPIDLTQQLQVSTALIDVPCSTGKTPLCWAVESSNLEAAKILINFGARLDVPNPYGNSIFHFAAASSKIEILELLIAAAYSVNPLCPQHSSISTNVYNNSLEELSTCKNNGCNIKTYLDQRDIDGRTPLEWAILFCKDDQAALLLSHGAATENPDCLTEAMRPSFALLLAIQFRNSVILELLLLTKARRDMKAKDGRSILHTAGICANLKILEILRDANLCCIGVTDRDNFGFTPLEVFDSVRPIRYPEDDQAHSECREAFVQLLENVRPAYSDHVCTVNGYPAEPDFVVANLSDTDDDDEFFDVGSTFEE